MKDGRFEVGDRVKCIDKGEQLNLTEKKEYEVLKRLKMFSEFVEITNDAGYRASFFANRFELVHAASQKQKASKVGQFMLWKAIELKCPEYCTTEDLEDINSWSEEILNKVIRGLQAFKQENNIGGFCPFCSAKKDCYKCGWGQRHGVCNDEKGALYSEIWNDLIKLANSSKTIEKIRELFPQVTLEIGGHKMAVENLKFELGIPDQFKDGDKIIMNNGDELEVKNLNKNRWFLVKNECLIVGHTGGSGKSIVYPVLESGGTLSLLYLVSYLGIEKKDIKEIETA